jgi:large subunit ribosomal protein L24
MSSSKIRSGDEVVLIAGKDRGRRGTVTAVRADGRVLVEGLNMAKKTVRPDPNQGIQGGIEEIEMPIHKSNVMVYNPQTGKGERVGFKWLGEGEQRRKVRVFNPSGELVDA